MLSTIYYPSNVEPTFGALAIVPGFGNERSHIDWYGARIASHGFVVILIDTISVWDIPDQRGEQLIAALDYLTMDSPVKDVVDAQRLAVMGYSFGGGGVIHATLPESTPKAMLEIAGGDHQCVANVGPTNAVP